MNNWKAQAGRIDRQPLIDPVHPLGGITASVNLKEGIVRNKMSQELQLSVGAFSFSKLLNVRGNIAIEEKSDCTYNITNGAQTF